MKKFNPISGDSFQRYKEAVNRTKGSKRDSLKEIELGMQTCYDEYRSAFDLMSVHRLNPHKFNVDKRKHLKSLYSSKAKIATEFREIFDEVNIAENRALYHICPYCGFSPADTLEHILPKETYPEYAVNSLNLIPCCPLCNSHKGEKVKDDANCPLFINFYYHNPDIAVFLIANFELDKKGFPIFKYGLSFNKDIDNNLKHIIINHFHELHLLERYNEKSVSEYVSLELVLISKNSPINKLIDWLKSYLVIQEQAYGKNHYKTALIRCLIHSDSYIEYISNKLK